MENKIEFIAKACHEANRVWCQANGDDTQKHWEEAEQWQRDSAIKGVEHRLNNQAEFQQKKDQLFCAIVDALK